MTQRQIEEIERDQKAPLAESYRRFLELIGRGARDFLQGSDVFHPSVQGLGQDARELLEENWVPFVWTTGDRVNLMHQGYQFDLLHGVGPDPEVWSYSDGTAVDVPVMSHSLSWSRTRSSPLAS